MASIDANVVGTLPNGSTVQLTTSAGSLRTGTTKDGSARLAHYGKGSALLVDKTGAVIVGPVDASAACDLAMAVASGDAGALTAPQSIHILAVMVLSLAAALDIEGAR